MKITKTISAEFVLSMKDLARAFCDLDQNEMAEFFNEVDKDVQERWVAPFEFQLEGLRTAENLSNGGREIMRKLGEYSQCPP